MNILVLYHSGVGSTKFVAELLSKELSSYNHNVALTSIEKPHNIDQYDLLCIGFPTYHASPSYSITNYIDKLPRFRAKKPAFIFTTCGLYSANTLRIFTKQCLEKNIIPIYYSSYRSPASDGVLVLPNLKLLQRFQKGLEKKIKYDVDNIFKASLTNKLNKPKFKFYSILNIPNKLGGKSFAPNIHLIKSECIKCKKCVIDCPHNCFSYDEGGYPIYSKSKCEHCYRCIHHCPKKALNIFKNKPPKVQLHGISSSNGRVTMDI